MSKGGRSYSDPSYGGHKDLNMGNKASIDGTYQSNVDIVRHTFMYPCKVVDWNLSIHTGGTNLGADVFFYLREVSWRNGYGFCHRYRRSLTGNRYTCQCDSVGRLSNSNGFHGR